MGFLETLVRTYGDLVRFRMGPRVAYLINQPELVRHVLIDHPERYRKGIGLRHARALFGQGLLTSEGAQWHRQRNAIGPVLHHRAIEAYVRPMVEEAECFVVSLGSRAAEVVDLDEALSGLALRVLLRTLFHTKLTEESERKIRRALRVVVEQTVGDMFSLRAQMWPDRLNRSPRLEDALAVLNREVIPILCRELPDGEPPDLISVLQRTGERRDEVLTFLLVGHETTAAALTWCCHVLAARSDIQDSVRQEVRRVCGGGSPTASHLTQLEYTRAVFEEVLRLYPPVWIIPRQSVEEDELNNETIRPGTDVLVSPYLLHRHAALWNDPERFQPQRFRTVGSQGRRDGYLPFGLGPRACIGAQFALAEALVVLTLLVRRFELTTATAGEIQKEALLTLRPRGGLPLWLRLASRCNPGNQSDTPS